MKQPRVYLTNHHDVCLEIDTVATIVTEAQAVRLVRDLNNVLAMRSNKLSQHPPTEEFNRIVGERIVRERKAMGISADYLHKRAGISKGFLSDVENGKRGIGSENLVKVARALGCKLEDLLP